MYMAAMYDNLEYGLWHRGGFMLCDSLFLLFKYRYIPILVQDINFTSLQNDGII